MNTALQLNNQDEDMAKKIEVESTGKVANVSFEMRLGHVLIENNLADLMNKHNIKGTDLSRETQITTANVYNIIHGGQNPTLGNLAKIVQAINNLAGKNYKLDDVIKLSYQQF
jgi:predicted transcriptional regulator